MIVGKYDIVRGDHGLRNHPLYHVWVNMRQRCLNKKDPRFYLYGGDGVTICDEWRSSFQSFYDWAISNGWQKGLELDKDKLSVGLTGKLYSPEMCCFISHKENAKHRRRAKYVEYKGETLTVSELSIKYNLDRRTANRQIVQWKWNLDRVINYKVKKKCQSLSV